MKHLIIGASIAGLSAAKRLKELSPNDDVVLLSGEKVMPYGKMTLPSILSIMDFFKSDNTSIYSVKSLSQVFLPFNLNAFIKIVLNFSTA